MHQHDSKQFLEASQSPIYIHTVRFHEVDPQSHVYHSRYLEIADAGFSDYLASVIGVAYSDLPSIGLDPAVVSTEVQFLAPAYYEDNLGVVVSPSHVGRSSFRMSINIFRTSDHRPIAGVSTTYVNFDFESSRSRPLPDRVSAILNEHIVAS